MTENAKRAIVFSVFALGLVLGLLGWMGDVYSSSVATILFYCFYSCRSRTSHYVGA